MVADFHASGTGLSQPDAIEATQSSTPPREIAEMRNQNDHHDLFDSSTFERRLSFIPTPYEGGIRATARWIVQARPGATAAIGDSAHGQATSAAGRPHRITQR